MYALRMIAQRANAVLFGNPLPRIGFALVGAILGLWQGPVTMIGFTAALIGLSVVLDLLARMPASPRVAKARPVSFTAARPHRA